MARRARSAQFETSTARLKLAPRKVPYGYVGLAPGIRLGYRRNVGAGTWTVKVAIRGPAWTARIGTAGDLEKADSVHVLDFWQACDKARKIARGSDADAGRPATIAEAVDSYEKDIRARGGSVANAKRIKRHLTAALANKPVSMSTVRDFTAWRDGLLAGGMKPTSAVRLFKSTKAALTLAAKSDPRILNRATWHDGLGGIAESFASRNVQRLNDDRVHRVVAEAYKLDPRFGLYVETAAVAGARLSQIARLTVADLQADKDAPRLLMPGSRKGRGRKPGKVPVPITSDLAKPLKAAARGRDPDAPLLLRADGLAWQTIQHGDHIGLYRQAAERAGITGTIYALRHSSIVRSLLAGVPIRVVAVLHDTSVVMIERTYSAYIADHADTIARKGLLASPPPAGNVVPLAGRKS
jgi:integrase